jgi:cell division protein ZapA
MKTQLKIQMLGSSFSIQSDQSRDQLEEILHYLNTKIDEVLEKNAGIEPVKIALLAALNIADELAAVRKSLAPGAPLTLTSEHEINKIAGHLIQRIDEALTDPKTPTVGD